MFTEVSPWGHYPVAALRNLRVPDGNSRPFGDAMATSPADTPLTATERAALEAKLRARQDELRAEITAQLKNQDDPRLVGLRNRMEDTDDWAVADAMAAMDIASVSRVLAILADVEAALARLADGSYGECIDCGVAIPYARLSAYPEAKRCVGCQEIAEALLRRSGSPR
ncbi:MAG TPA: TraR/DksA family transcriptional regulator [Casimicrobiaceae bacterium]|jgi:RNA polymerase-binding transcription factor DksA